ncbi:MAG: hypothetical protein HY080_11625 [Gammaproteobacteria bacterium]|nr:hypothetical protein [Gammaproteobacteria bacterium]
MIVYALFPDDTNKKHFVYQESVWDLAMTGKRNTTPEGIFNCQPDKKVANWHPPGIRWFDDDGRNINKYKDPDITELTPGSYFLGPRAAELLRPVINDVAELLPVPFQGETWYFMNVFHWIDAIDKANSRYAIYSTGKQGWLEKPAFLADKVPHAKLFMIPEARGRIYYAEHHPDDNPNTFKNVVEKNKLFGIEIDKVWEN